MWEYLPELPANSPIAWDEYVKNWEYSPLTRSFTLEVKASEVTEAVVSLLDRLKDALCEATDAGAEGVLLMKFHLNDT